MNIEQTRELTEHDLIDPDVRFLLANERTLLAWIRTALALMAGGVALTQFGEVTYPRVLLGITIILMGVSMSMIGFMRFKAADKAIRAAELPDTGKGPALQIAGVFVFALSLIVVEVLSYHIK